MKNASPKVILANSLVLYTYTVTNTGDVSLANPKVVDNKCSPVAYLSGDNGNGLLDPGEIWLFQCVTSLAADTVNTAIASGQPSNPQGLPLPGIPPVSAQDTESVDVVAPKINLVKSASAPIVNLNGSVLYTFTVTNPGDTPLVNVNLVDNQCSPLSAPVKTGGDNDGLLEPGETWTYTCTKQLTQDTTNTATVTGDPSDANGNAYPNLPPVSDQDSASVNVINPALAIKKTPSATLVNPGTNVTYTYEVTNPGDDPLANVVVTDNTCSPVTYVSGDSNNNNKLDPGEKWVYTCSMVLNSDTTNIATVNAKDSLTNNVPPASDTAFVDVIIAGINVVKSASDTIVYAGNSVVYTYNVTNTGSNPIRLVVVIDNWCGPVVYQSGDTNLNGWLDQGELWVYKCTATLLQDTVNTVTATGLNQLGQPLSDSDSASVNVINPSVRVEKVADKTVILSGSTVVYSYKVTNTGDDPLDDQYITVNDNQCSPVVLVTKGNGDNIFDPGEVWTYTCVKFNMTLDTPIPSPSTPRIPTAGRSAGRIKPTSTWSIRRSRSPKSADYTVVIPGGLVQYTYLVTNPGDVPLANVNVVDNKCAPVVYGSGDANNNGLLDVGETWTYTCTASLAADTTNTVTATGQPSDNQGQPLPGIPPVKGTDTETVDVVHPAIHLVKTANPTTGAPRRPGDLYICRHQPGRRTAVPGDRDRSAVRVPDLGSGFHHWR